MIEKERLQELIEQQKQVWKIYKDTCQGVYQVPAGLFGIGFSSQVDETTPFNELFETKEEAEWHKEFGCIERTERLELPTWEEFLILEKIYSFKSKNNQIVVLFSDNHTIYLEDENWNILREDLTKENYTLACRKVKELFLGLGE